MSHLRQEEKINIYHKFKKWLANCEASSTAASQMLFVRWQQLIFATAHSSVKAIFLSSYYLRKGGNKF
jgi:hypothetical protein